jgi:hypothetical protein
MNINGQNIDSTFSTGLNTSVIEDIGNTVQILLSTNTINLIGTNVLVNSEPIGGGGGGITNPLSSDLLLNGNDVLGSTFGTSLNSIADRTINISRPTLGQTIISGTIQADTIVKTGGTNSQYLMADGTALTFSANSGNSNFYLYDNSTSGTPTPAVGNITYNNAVQSLATIIYISHISRDNIDIEVFFSQISTLTDVYIQDQSLSENYIQYNITGTPVITINAQVAIPVTVRTSAGTGTTNFPNQHNLLLSFFTNAIETSSRLSTLETKTQNLTSIVGTTGFTGNIICDGIGGVTAPIFIKTGGLSSQFLKADGSVDTNIYSYKKFAKNTITSSFTLTPAFSNILPTAFGSLNIEANEAKAGDIYKIVIEGAWVSSNGSARPIIKLTVGGNVWSDLNIFPISSGSFSFKYTHTFSFVTAGAISTGSSIIFLETGSLSTTAANSQMAGAPSSLPTFNATIQNSFLIQAYCTSPTITCSFAPYMIYMHRI